MSEMTPPKNETHSMMFVRLLQKYDEENPGKRASLSRHHPAVVCAVNTDVWCALVDHFGGVTQFWQAYLPALKEWFDPNVPAVELPVIWGQFFISCGMASQAGMTSMDDVSLEYEAWFAPARKWFGKALLNVYLIPSVHVPSRGRRTQPLLDDPDLG